MTTNQLITKIGRQRVLTALSNVVCSLGGDTDWGDIGGTISDQIDLQAALDAKQNTITPAALTKTDDTNVTITLGGTPTTALLQAVSLVLGWAGQLSAARGGTGQSTFNTWASWTPTFGGFSSDPTGVDCRYTLNGKLLCISVFMNEGTSNATTFTMTLPSGINARTGAVQTLWAQIRNNGSTQGTPGMVNTISGSNVLNLYISGSGAPWTGSSTKYARFTGTIEID